MINSSGHLLGIVAALFILWAGAAAANETVTTEDPLALTKALVDRGLAFYQQGNYRQSEPLLREALEIRQRTLPADDPHIAALLNDLGASLQYQSRFNEAELLYKRALEIFSRSDAFRAERSSTLGNLASVYREQGKIEDANRVYAQLFELFTIPGAVSELTQATVYNGYGMLLKAKGDWSG